MEVIVSREGGKEERKQREKRKKGRGEEGSRREEAVTL